MSVLSWRAWQAPRSNQQSQYPQTELSMQLAPRSTQQPKYSLKRHDLHVAFALHIMGVYVRPFFLRMHMTRQTSRRCRRAPPINYQFVVRPSVRPSFLPSFIHSFIHSVIHSQAYDKQLSSPARSTGHQPSTPSTALFMMHSSSLDIVRLEPIHLSWAARSVSPNAIWRASSNPFATIRIVTFVHACVFKYVVVVVVVFNGRCFYKRYIDVCTTFFWSLSVTSKGGFGIHQMCALCCSDLCK
jgi:hypothetical protein